MWFVGGVTALLVVAELTALPARRWIIQGALLVGAGGLLTAHLFALVQVGDRAQLLASYALVTAAAVFALYRRRLEGALALPALGGLLGGSALWAIGVAPEWWAYPGLAAAGAILAAEPWWRRRDLLREAGWPYLLTVAIAIPVAFSPLYTDRPAHGVAAYTIAALIVLAAALRVRGALARLVMRHPDERALMVER